MRILARAPRDSIPHMPPPHARVSPSPSRTLRSATRRVRRLASSCSAQLILCAHATRRPSAAHVVAFSMSPSHGECAQQHTDHLEPVHTSTRARARAVAALFRLSRKGCLSCAERRLARRPWWRCPPWSSARVLPNEPNKRGACSTSGSASRSHLRMAGLAVVPGAAHRPRTEARGPQNQGPTHGWGAGTWLRPRVRARPR